MLSSFVLISEKPHVSVFFNYMCMVDVNLIKNNCSPPSHPPLPHSHVHVYDRMFMVYTLLATVVDSDQAVQMLWLT